MAADGRLTWPLHACGTLASGCRCTAWRHPAGGAEPWPTLDLLAIPNLSCFWQLHIRQVHAWRYRGRDAEHRLHIRLTAEDLLLQYQCKTGISSRVRYCSRTVSQNPSRRCLVPGVMSLSSNGQPEVMCSYTSHSHRGPGAGARAAAAAGAAPPGAGGFTGRRGAAAGVRGCGAG